MNGQLAQTLEEHLRKAGSGATVSNQGGPRAHRLVAASARAQAGEYYEVACGKIPGLADAYPNERAFVRQYWVYFIESARTCLAVSLAGNMREDLKEQIHEALLKDASLRPTRANIPQIKLDL
jgi:hypothetical protein